jgi:DNA-binding MarR family transcriptional regulator
MAAGKRTVGRLVVENVPTCPDPSHLLVVHAVELGPATDHDEVTVGLVAGRLGVDPSRASRLVAGAIRSGLLRRVASQEDGRRSRLELTELGHILADCGRRIRLELVAGAMAEWDATERAEFARLLERFTDGLCTNVSLTGTETGAGAGTDPGKGADTDKGTASTGAASTGTGTRGTPDAGAIPPPDAGQGSQPDTAPGTGADTGTGAARSARLAASEPVFVPATAQRAEWESTRRAAPET